jgi:hypothetical protein
MQNEQYEIRPNGNWWGIYNTATNELRDIGGPTLLAAEDALARVTWAESPEGKAELHARRMRALAGGKWTGD